MDLGAKVRKGFVQKVVHAILIWCGIRLRCVVDEVIGKQFVEQRALVLPRTTVGITEASAGHHRQTMTELTTNRASAAGPSSVDRSPSTASQLDRPVAPGLNRAQTPADSCYRRTC